MAVQVVVGLPGVVLVLVSPPLQQVLHLPALPNPLVQNSLDMEIFLQLSLNFLKFLSLIIIAEALNCFVFLQQNNENLFIVKKMISVFIKS